jgi:hypothetical protein
MKTLQQVEPRVPISSAPFTISQPGSYYLTTNLTVSGGNAITIATNGVTLDLNGFTISSTTNPASGTAVLINGGLQDITIQNGHIRGGVTNNGSGVFSGPGFGYGIYGLAPNVRVSGVSVSGCLSYGINVGFGEGTTVENCGVRTVGSWGIVASTIRGCVALDCGSHAIYGQQVSDSRGESVGSGDGLLAITAQNCYGSSGSGGYGLYAYNAQNCYGYSYSYYGLYAEGTAIGCSGYSSSSTGLYATTAQNCYGQSSSGYGLYASKVASGCYGSSGSGAFGLYASIAQNCYGSSSGFGYGLYAGRTAIGCYGSSSGSGTGLSATTAQNCYGSSSSGTGLYADTAQNCYGESNSGTGLYAVRTAIGCYGYSFSGPRGLYSENAAFCTGSHYQGTAIEAIIANGCWAEYGTNFIAYKYNMP